jgi:hypothetical protein
MFGGNNIFADIFFGRVRCYLVHQTLPAFFAGITNRLLSPGIKRKEKKTTKEEYLFSHKW